MKTCFIVGGGESLINFDFEKIKSRDIIAINNSILKVPEGKYFITMDYMFQHKTDIGIWNSFNGTKIFVANFDNNYMIEKDGQIVDSRNNLIYDLSSFNMIIKSYKLNGIGESFKDFRTGKNSGYCGLQLAILMGYTEIYLLGFDLTYKEKTHFHSYYRKDLNTYQKTLDEYYQYFKTGIAQLSGINIYNCCKKGKLANLLPYKEIE